MNTFDSINEHCYKLGKTAKEMHEALLKTDGSIAPSTSTIFRWFIFMKIGNSTIIRNKGSRSTQLQIDEELVMLVNQNPFATTRSLGDAIGVSHCSISNHLRRLNYSKKKLFNLTQNHLKDRLQISKELILQSSQHFLHRIVTSDEKWV